MSDMSGAQLTVAIFFWGSAVVIGLDALKAEGWRRIVFWILTSAFALCGFLVKPLWDAFPDLSAALVRLVHSPFTWFGLGVVGYLVLRFPTGRDRQPIIADEFREIIRDELRPASMSPDLAQEELPARRFKLSAAEQERLTDRLIKLDDFLTGDLRDEILPFRDLMDWSEFLRFNGGAALHAKIEAPRRGLSERIRQLGQKLKVFDDETSVLNLHPLFIKTRMLPLEGALHDMSCVSELLGADNINNAPLRLPGRLYNQAVTEVQDEIDRVRRDIASWRKRIAEGELD